MSGYAGHKARLMRSYYGGIGKHSIIYPSAFCTSLGIGLVNLGLIFFARDIMGLTPSRVGMLAATSPVFYTLSCLLLRPVFDHIFPRYLIIASSLLMFIFISGITPSTPVSLVFAACGLFGAAMGLFWSPMMAWLSLESEGIKLGRLLSLFNLSWGIGGVISPYVCGLLYVRLPTLPLRFGSILFLLVAVFVTGASLSLPRIRNDSMKGGGSVAEESAGDQSSPIRYPAWVGLWVSYFGVGVLYTVFPLISRRILGLTETSIGFLLLFFNLFNLIGFFVLGRTGFWHFRFYPMIISLFVRSTAFFLMIYASSRPSIALLMVLFGTTMSMSYSASIFHGSSGSVNRSQRMGIHEAVLASGAVCGSFFGGFIYEHISVAALYGLVSVITLTGMFIQIIYGIKFARAGASSAFPQQEESAPARP